MISMIKNDKKITNKKKTIKYNIYSIYNKNGKEMQMLLEEIFINYCMNEFRKSNL